MLVEQFQLTHGSTWHSAGLVGQLRSTISLTRMMQYSVGLYAELTELTGKDPGWHQLGGLRLASSQARLEEIRRQAGLGTDVRAADGDRVGEGGAGALPAAERRGRSRRRLSARRRLPRPEPADVRARRRRPRARGPDRAAHQRDRHPPSRRAACTRSSRTRARSNATWWSTPPACTRRRSGASWASKSRSSRSGTSIWSRSRSTRRCRRCRRCATPTTSSTSAPRSAGSSWAATSASRTPGRSTASRRASRRGCCPRTGSAWRSCCRTRSSGCRSMETQPVKMFFNGPEAFTPDAEFVLGESDVPGFFVAAGFCAHGLAGRRRRGQGHGGVDRRRPARVGPLAHGHPPLQPALPQSALRARPRLRVAVEVLRHQVPGRGEAGRAAPACLVRLPPPRGARRRVRREGRLGARQLVRVQRGHGDDGAAPARLGGRELVAGDRRRGAGHTPARRACSTSRASRSSR